ncbi:hypothetical protein [Allokutzneria albata]|uniref:hypothetical protein n=1 Tax=Allokutzneria albata TaxID=211114 RepID=UPI0012DD8599|nr:hypothetical protein [Allokutzneria albata]
MSRRPPAPDRWKLAKTSPPTSAPALVFTLAWRFLADHGTGLIVPGSPAASRW